MYANKETEKEAYWESMFNHREQKDFIEYVNWMNDTKNNIKDREDERKDHIEQMEQEMMNIENPLRHEIDTCKFLISICNKLKERSGLIVNNEKVARETQIQMDKERVEERQNAAIKAGKIEIGMSKADREESEMVRIGGGKKNKGKRAPKKEAKAQDFEDPFTHDISIV